MARGALKFKQQVVRQPQELGRLRVIGGTDAGAVYIITSNIVTIGRGEENEIAVMDLKMSRRHAEISQTKQGVLIKDLGSANGLMINGSAIKQWFLKTGDKVGIGSSVFEYISPEGVSQLMVQAQAAQGNQQLPKEVGTGTSGLTKFIMIPGKGGSADQTRTTQISGAQKQQNLFEKNKKFVMTLLGVVVLATLAPQAELQVKKRRKKYEPPTEVTQNSNLLKNFLPQAVDLEQKKKAESYFNEGYREFIEKNYLRAKANFEVALQILPSHDMARVYRDKTIKAMEDDAKNLKSIAKRDEEGNRLESALKKYDDIRRLYYRDQTNPAYKEANDAYMRLQKKIKDVGN